MSGSQRTVLKDKGVYLADLGPTEIALLRSAEREIAQHGYSGAQLKRAARRLEMNPAQYNYYFATLRRKAIEGVADVVYRASLAKINEYRIEMIRALDDHYGVETLRPDEKGTGYAPHFSGDIRYTLSDILTLSLLPVARHIISDFYSRGESYFGRFALMMYLEAPNVYHYIVTSGVFSSHTYLNAMGGQLLLDNAALAPDADPQILREKILKMQWQLLSTFESDLPSGDMGNGDHMNQALGMIDAALAYTRTSVLGLEREVDALEQKMLFSARIT